MLLLVTLFQGHQSGLEMGGVIMGPKNSADRGT